MAENTVEIVVRAKNKTKEGFASAAKDAEEQGSLIERIWDKHAGNINKNLKNIGGGLGKGALFTTIGTTALAAAGPVGALGLAVGAFGALAIPTLSKVNDYLTGTKKQAADAWAAMDPKQRGIAKSLKDVGSALTKAFEPSVITVLSLVAKTFKDLAPALTVLAKAGAQVLTAFLAPLDKFIQSKTFKQLIDQFASFAVQMAKMAGPQMTALLAALLTLFVKLMPAGLKILQLLLPALVTMVIQLTPIAVGFANIIAKVTQWLSKNGLLVPALWLLVGAFIALKLSILTNPITLIAAAIIALAIVIVKYHTQIWTFIKRIWNDIFTFVKWIWDTIWNNTTGRLIRGYQDVVKWFDTMRHHIAVVFDGVRHEIAHVWDVIWNNTIGRISRGIGDAVTWFKGLPGKVLNALSSFGNMLYTLGKNVVTRMWDGLKAIFNGASGVIGWVGDLPGRVVSALGKVGSLLYDKGKAVIQGFFNGLLFIWNGVKGVAHWIGSIATWIKNHKGPLSLDAQLLHPAGVAMMTGFFNGLKKGFGPVGSFVGGIAGWILGKIKGAGGKLLDGKVVEDLSQFSAGNLAYSVGGGVQQWRGLVSKALRMEGLSQQLVDAVLYQMMTESGGNPRAINLTDINAQRGDPSRGLMQVIGSTFRAYHWPGTSWNIYDPMANIAAALNYARHNYGPGLRNAYGGIGTGRGYASGGIASGGWAMVGEHGRELIKLPPGAHVYSNADSSGMGGGAIELLVSVDSAAFMQAGLSPEMIKAIKFEVRRMGGGNVQTAFGIRGR